MPTDLTLPALKSLGDLADTKPTVVIDSREQSPLVFRRLPSVVGTLLTGDYSIRGAEHLFAVERKSVADLAACCMGENRRRFERELHRLRGFHWRRLLIIGTELEIQQGVPFSRIRPASVFGSLSAWECRFDVPIVWCHTPEAAAVRVERWVCYFASELVKSVNGLRRAESTSEKT